MAVKKRRSTKSAAAVASVTNSDEVISEFQAPGAVLRHLQEIATSKSRSEGVLQAFLEGKCWTEPQPSPGASSSSPTTKQPKQPHLDCYWIILATSLLNRLLASEKREDRHGKNDQAEQECAVYMTALADAVATVLLSDKNKLEKSSHHASSRSVLCRAVLTASMASLHCVRNYDHPSTLEAAVTTLDRLVHLKPSASRGDTSTTKLSTAGLWTADELEKESERVGRLLGYRESEEACVRALIHATSGATSPSIANDSASDVSEKSPPAKRSARSRSGSRKPVAVPVTSSPSSTPVGSTGPITTAQRSARQVQNVDPDAIVITAFQDLLKSDEFGSRIDGRVAVKRWASIAVVWSQKGEGQLQLLKATHELAEAVSSALSASQKSIIMYKLICIASEAGTNCGVRPPSGGIDQYLKSIATKRQQRQGKAGGSTSKKPKILRRADIRDWTTVVIYDFLQNHQKCLQSESPALGTSGVVNGDVVENGNKDEEQDMTTETFLAPDFGSAITSLCRSASSSVPNSNYAEQASWNKALTSIAAANCIDLIADPSLPLDCKLAQFVASHLADCIKGVDPDSMSPSTSSDETHPGEDDIPTTVQQRDFDSIYLLRKALPKPCISGECGGLPEDGDLVTPRGCTFAGVLAAAGCSYSTASFTDEQAVCLAIRAIQRRKGDQSPPAGKIWTFLIEMIERIYDTRRPMVEPAKQDEDKNKSSSNKRKNPNKPSPANRRGRRRRTDHGEAIINDDVMVWHRITSLRASVASEILASLRCCLLKTRKSAFTIRQLIRRFLKTEHLQNIIRLGDMLDHFIIKTRNGVTNFPDKTKIHAGDVQESSILGSSSLNGNNHDFTHFEKQLWSAHMSMCQVLGRGQLTYEANSGLDPEVWDSCNRHAVYKAIAKSEECSRGGLGGKWPLSLPSPHLAFLNANMSCIPVSQDKAIERSMVEGYVDSIGAVLENLECLQTKTSVEEFRFLDDEIPLSYEDARTFMLAINGLSWDERRTHLERLVNATRTALSSIAQRKAEANEICKNAEVSGFLARVIVVCYSMINSIVAGRELQTAYLATMGCSQMSLPAFVTHSEWYRRDRTFMGLFDSWESPSLPEGIADRQVAYLPAKILTDLRAVLEMSFSLGFDCASNDHCQLLFTAWNGLDQLPPVDESLNPAAQVPTLKTETGDYTRKILDMREDVCSIHNAIGRNGIREKGHVSNSSNSTCNWSDANLKSNLKDMIIRANTLVESLLRSHVPDDDDMVQEIPMPVFVLLASLPSYISASVACHSKAGNDYFSTALSKSVSKSSKRQRGYSSESDPPVESEGDSTVGTDDYENDVRIEALSRLKECCCAFGAAPIHPDWLDVSCTLQDGVRPNDAVEVAEIAIKTLSHLVTVAFSQYKHHQFRALKSVQPSDRSGDRNANLAMALLGWFHHEAGAGQNPSDRDWKNDVAAVTEISQEVFQHLLNEHGNRDAEQAKESWCPYAGQRLPGLLHDGSKLLGGWESAAPAELRACGEWELLLSEALAISCIQTIKPGTETQLESSLVKNESIHQEFYDELTKARLWRNIFLTATSNLMPAAALLRLGMAKVGRKPHPFSFHENNQDPYDVESLRFSERLLGVTYASYSLTVSVFETLTVLARLCVEAEESLSATCHAVASHLMVNSDSLTDLVCLYSLRCDLTALNRMREVGESSPKKDVKNAIPRLVQRLLAPAKDFGKHESTGLASSSRESPMTGFQGLRNFVGRPGLCLVDTVVGNSIDVFKILKTGKIKELHEDRLETYHWSEEDRQRMAIGELVSALCLNSLQATDRTRSQIAQMLSRIGVIELTESLLKPLSANDLVVAPAVIQAFNSVDKKRLKSLLLKDLCGIRSESPSTNIGKELGSLFSLLLFTNGKPPDFEKAQFVHDTLMSVFDSWNKIQPSEKEHILGVLVIYGARFGSLMKLGSTLLDAEDASLGGESSVRAKLLAFFFSSIRQLHQVLQREGRNDSRSSNEASDAVSIRKPPTEEQKPNTVNDYPRSCSFIQRSGFHGQHWYHCHTCNLVSDKGCCSLCALVCHRDHDVAYSRYSSFFCDCAAEDGHPGEKNRVSCKCLSPLSENEINGIFESESSHGKSPPPSQAKGSDHGCRMQGSSMFFESSSIVDIARVSFREVASNSVRDFIRDVKQSPWLEALFLVLDKEFKIWKENNANSMLEALLQQNSEAEKNLPIFRVSHESMRRSLRNRRSKVLSLQQLVQSCLAPIRAAKGFQAKFSSDSTTHTLTLARLARNDIQRSILATDSRGRMVIAEPCSLVFCCPIPAVNIRYVKRSCDEELPRHKMSILGTATLKFNVVGMCLCAENERHLVVWGTSEACVVILKPDYDGIDDTINLVFELDHQDGEGDFLVKCEWLSRSQTHVAVGCSRFVRLYDICRLDSEKRANPVIGYNLGFESSLRDFCIVPCDNCCPGNDIKSGSLCDFRGETVSKLFLLLENGRLHALDLKTSNGKIESPGELHFEPSECLSISTAGIRPRLASPIGPSGASTRTLGEGSRLAYLKQSRVLLYKCKSAAVVAMMLEEDGSVNGTFELLPHSLSTEILGNDEDGYSITGPYTHWTELGLVYRDGGAFFRVACLGRSTRGSQPKILCVEFNDVDVRIKELSWSSMNSPGLGISPPMSFEGLAAFSTPVLETECASPPRCQYLWGERACLCALTPEGNLLIFGEEVTDVVPTNSSEDSAFATPCPVKLVSLPMSSDAAIRKPEFPLTLFERLKNVSESNDVVIVGSDLGIDSSELRSRLSRDNTASVVCARREGCFLRIALAPKNEENPALFQKSHPEDQNKNPMASTSGCSLAIAAVRILVGSTIDYMPSKIYVQGRPVDVTPRVKRWYNVPLTDEEIAMGLRTGFVSVWIGPSFDPSNSPVIDSVEVFAIDKSSIEKMIPRSLFSVQETTKLHASLVRLEDCKVISNSLVKSVHALTSLCQLMGPSVQISDSGRTLLQQIIQETALHPEKHLRLRLQDLLECVEPDKISRWSLQDESLLVGCTRSLEALKELGKKCSCEGTGVEPAATWKSIRAVLQDCLKTSSKIARERPINYLQSMGNMLENKVSGSIAVDAAALIVQGLKQCSSYEDLIGGPEGIVALSLTETAIDLNSDASKSQKFAQFGNVRAFLDDKNVSVVEKCCHAISSFFGNYYEEESINKSPDLFVQLEAARLVAYQCDSCAMCPMKEVRYTDEGSSEDYGIDLCKECYGIGTAYAKQNNYDANAQVLIRGNPVGGETKLSCAHMREMKPVSLQKMDIKQVEILSSKRHASPEESMDDDEDLQKALKLSLGENSSDDVQHDDLPTGYQGYEDFLGALFAFVMEILSTTLKKDRGGMNVGPLIKLALDLIGQSKRDSFRQDRAKHFVKEVASGISNIMNYSPPNRQKLDHEKTLSLGMCLRALSSLLAPDSETFIPSSKPDDFDRSQAKNKETSSSRFVCDVHGIPAVRRRCSKGVNKDRRFYVCGKEKEQRCAFLVWVDERGLNSGKTTSKSHLHDVIKSFLWNRSSAGMSLHSRLCSLLELEILGEESGIIEASFLASKTKVRQGEDSVFKSAYDGKSMEKDFSDGVFCSKEKLGDVTSGTASIKATVSGSLELTTHINSSYDSGALLLDAAGSLLTLVADHRTEGISRWLSMLCEISMTTNQLTMKSLATKVLKSLCGGKRALYQSVRDHFAFAIQLKKIYRLSCDLLDAALIVKEKARQCTDEWATTEVKDWSNLGAGDLIGTQDLIPEDAISEVNANALAKVLADLFSLIKNRGQSWRQFCGLRALPHSHREDRNASSQQRLNGEVYLANVAPIISLLWIASAANGNNQVKVLRLVDFALTDWKESNTANIKVGGGSSEDEGNHEHVEEGEVGFGQETHGMPEAILMSGDMKLTVPDVVAFSQNMVQSGKTTELRRVACQIVTKLVQTLSDDEKWLIFQYLVVSIEKIGVLGKASAEFFTLLQLLGRNLSPRNGVGAFAEHVLEGFVRQLDALKYDRANGEWAQLETANRKTKIDMSGCFFCLKSHQPVKRETVGKRSERRGQSVSNRSTSSQANSGASTVAATCAPTQKWHLDQVCPFSRGRLESGKESSTSSEFSSFYKLKYRVAISEITLTVNDPRGRYVKVVNVFISPRPVAVVAELKSDLYSTKWQKCATLSLSRGATRAHTSLAYPVVAANIKVEFAEFYERPGEKGRAGDGSMSVHCPRCTRVVTNAHGVCGNCGEVAFQCRKCRHINYDRLDAFLCVECGYCPMGTFSLEVNAGVATNAIAITNDKDYDKALKMLGTATSVQEELREVLGEKLRSLYFRKQSSHEQTNLDSFFDPDLQRAFLGLPPDDVWEGKDTPRHGKLRLRIDKQGSVVKFVARPEASHGANDRSTADGASDRSERTRSLLRLARQIRSESGSSAERRRSTDVIIRHLGRGMALDGLDDEDDLVDLLESGNVLDSGESPIGASDAAGRSGDVDRGSHRRKKTEHGTVSSRKIELEECLKVNMQMKEAGREAYELRRRISAWNCLESGYLVLQPKSYPVKSLLSGEKSLEFSPSRCPTCGGSVAHQLLILWLTLFLVDPSQVRVDNYFVELLVQDDLTVTSNNLSHQSKGLGECKKEVVVSIATKSEKGAEIVLNVLKSRLVASQDMNSAAILGKILEVEGFSMSEEYTKFAMEILASQSTTARYG